MERLAAKKHKRTRKAPYRKWTDREQQDLVDFLRDNTPMEKPTAQIYYKQFLKQTNSDLEWTLVRCKVKNLRYNFFKAMAWEHSNSAVATRDGKTVRAQILRICPHYDTLKILFKREKKDIVNREREREPTNLEPESITADCNYEASINEIKTESESIHTMEPFEIRRISPHSFEPSNYNATETENLPSNSNNNNLSPETEPQMVHNTCSFIPNTSANHNNTTNLSSNYNPNMVINQLLQLEETRERNRMDKSNVDADMQDKQFLLEERRLDLEEKKFSLEERKMDKLNVELQLQEKKFLLEDRKVALEERKFDLEERKADREYELRKMELEMKERLMRYEYELKYKQHN